MPKMPDGRYLYEVDGRLVTRQRLWQIRHKAERRCFICGVKLRRGQGKACNVHRQARAKLLRAAYHRKHPSARYNNV